MNPLSPSAQRVSGVKTHPIEIGGEQFAFTSDHVMGQRSAQLTERDKQILSQYSFLRDKSFDVVNYSVLHHLSGTALILNYLPYLNLAAGVHYIAYKRGADYKERYFVCLLCSHPNGHEEIAVLLDVSDLVILSKRDPFYSSFAHNLNHLLVVNRHGLLTQTASDLPPFNPNTITYID